ncbi:N-acetylmuramoyl-L-alanine amidase [Nitrosomonas halophila]|uniref:N-acetylmuramoyl-L-alanine amidase n=1 Tax=Nitrosomonas halophila TaxID=44576 RepID=A0A1H3FDY8_9PROT|nr:N-acetylmuramoyl-L-alanine amidase [Nitrosomonas halophila]SDX88997.1 N-acetylmuramoyl-L-alanine amidase [Nitrosomonas halophila]
MNRPISHLVIHCAATPNGRWHDVRDIDLWHRQAGFRRNQNWRARQNEELGHIGYHFVIYTNGAVATGRHLDEVGAHARGFNARTIGICMIGTDRFSPAQWESLHNGVSSLIVRYRGVKVVGHRDLPEVKKTCPGFSVDDWLANQMQPLPGHVLGETHEGK